MSHVYPIYQVSARKTTSGGNLPPGGKCGGALNFLLYSVYVSHVYHIYQVSARKTTSGESLPPGGRSGGLNFVNLLYKLIKSSLNT